MGKVNVLVKAVLGFLICTLFFIIQPVSPAFALSIFQEDFSAFTGSGFAPSPSAGQLDSDQWRVLGLSDGDMAFGETKTTGDFARGSSTGGVSTGGVYAFDVGGGNLGLGIQPSGPDFTSGALTLKLSNSTSSTINSLSVSYSVFVFNDQPRSNDFRFMWSTSTTGAPGSYTLLTALDVVSLETAATSPTWQQFNRSTMISGLGLAPSDNLFLQWAGNDLSGSGARDQFALDNILVETTRVSAVPEPATMLLLGTGLVGVAGAARRRKKNQA